MVSRLSDSLWTELTGACREVRLIGPRELLTRTGQAITESALLLDGIMARCVAAEAGHPDSRLMVAVQVPGDFVDLHGLPLGRLDHDVRTVTSVRVAFFPHEALEQIMSKNADHARALWSLTMIDASIHRHWTYRGGRLRALASVADFLCEFDLRMQMCMRSDGNLFPMPFTQADLAEITGLSKVHVSRVMKELRDAGLCTFQDGMAQIHDRTTLEKFAGYDPGYLYIPSSPSSY